MRGIDLILRAVGLFAVTNLDDIVVLAVFFGQARDAVRRIVIGQYAGFLGILVVAVIGALGATLLPEKAIPYLGLLPIALGLRAAHQVWRDRHDRADTGDRPATTAVTTMAVAGVTFANGGDNLGVYVPVFAAEGTGAIAAYCAVFLVLVAAWCRAGHFVATRPVIARALTRWGHLVLPGVLIAIGLVILIGGIG